MGKLAAVAGIAFLGVVAVGYWYFQVPPKRDRKELTSSQLALASHRFKYRLPSFTSSLTS